MTRQAEWDEMADKVRNTPVVAEAMRMLAEYDEAWTRVAEAMEAIELTRPKVIMTSDTDTTSERRIPRRKKARKEKGYKACHRPFKYRNDFEVSKHGLEESLRLYYHNLVTVLETNPDFLKSLLGYDLGCFCDLEDVCHVDIIFMFLYWLYGQPFETKSSLKELTRILNLQ